MTPGQVLLLASVHTEGAEGAAGHSGRAGADEPGSALDLTALAALGPAD